MIAKKQRAAVALPTTTPPRIPRAESQAVAEPKNANNPAGPNMQTAHIGQTIAAVTKKAVRFSLMGSP